MSVREVAPIARADRGLPFLGRFVDYLHDPVALMQELYDGYGPVAPMRNLGGTQVMLLGPDACGEALVNREKAFVNGPAWGRIVGPFFRNGLMLLDGDHHHLHRRIMQQAFTRDRLAGYADAMPPAIAAGLAEWTPADGFAAYPALKQLTLDIAADIFMGGAPDHDRAAMDQVNRAFVDCVQAAAGVLRGPVPFTRWGRAYRGRKLLDEFLRHYLPARRATRTEDLFSVLCHIESDDGERFSDDDVIDHMVFLMMAAHDTSTITLSTMVQYLGQHPEWQERCRAEALAAGERPALSALDAMTDADLVMREALRLRAPVPVLMRRTVKDVDVAGVRIPADTDVLVAPQFSQLMAELWTDPERFDPDRFSPDRREDKTHRFAWEPFGGGVHKCIGLYFAGAEVKAVLHRLLLDFEWSVDPDYVAPMNHASLPFPTDGQPIDLRRR